MEIRDLYQPENLPIMHNRIYNNLSLIFQLYLPAIRNIFMIGLDVIIETILKLRYLHPEEATDYKPTTISQS